MRRGSTRFPGKNLAPLGGQPLYRWTLDAARFLGYPYTVFHNYPGPFLPADVREVLYEGDGTTMQEVARALDADLFVMLPVTSPFRDTAIIRAAVARMVEEPRLKASFAVKKVKDGFYYNGYADSVNHTARWRGGRRYPEPLEMYRETGGFYVLRRCQLEKIHPLMCAANERRMVRDRYGFDIDTAEDLREAQAWLNTVSG